MPAQPIHSKGSHISLNSLDEESTQRSGSFSSTDSGNVTASSQSSRSHSPEPKMHFRKVDGVLHVSSTGQDDLDQRLSKIAQVIDEGLPTFSAPAQKKKIFAEVKRTTGLKNPEISVIQIVSRRALKDEVDTAIEQDLGFPNLFKVKLQKEKSKFINFIRATAPKAKQLAYDLKRHKFVILKTKKLFSLSKNDKQRFTIEGRTIMNLLLNAARRAGLTQREIQIELINSVVWKTLNVVPFDDVYDGL